MSYRYQVLFICKLSLSFVPRNYFLSVEGELADRTNSVFHFSWNGQAYFQLIKLDLDELSWIELDWVRLSSIEF